VAEDVPICVRPGWIQSTLIANVGGPTYRLLAYSDTEVGFEHLCDRGDRGVIICAPLLMAEHRHEWTRDAADRWQPTITPSILCPDCGTHGFVREGRWVSS
jgi:hypothetical protein